MNANKTLTKKAAEEILANSDPEYAIEEEVADYTSIEDDAAEILSKYTGFAIYLKNLNSISTEAAKHLSAYPHNLGFSDYDGWSDELYSGIKSIDVGVAEALSHHIGDTLYLDGLANIEDDVAQYLASWNGAGVSLKVEEQDEYVFVVLGPNPYETTLEESRIRQFKSTEKAYAFVEAYREIMPGNLLLRGLTTLSDQAANYFSKSKAMLYFNSGIKMSKKAAKFLGDREVGIDKHFMASDWIKNVWNGSGINE